jgi:hypothetical protein
MPPVLLICLIFGLSGLVAIYVALKALFPGDVEYLTIDGKTYTIKMDKCHCGNRKAARDEECYHCSQVDRCECGELKDKRYSFCGACLMELRHEGRITRRGPGRLPPKYN